MSEQRNHWQQVFSSKTEQEVSWYEQRPAVSIALFEQCDLAKDSPIIDVGCGDSYFLDYLMEEGFSNITALDISEEALSRAKQRLGAKAKEVTWVVSDILDYIPAQTFAYWHDRASFHFQTEQVAINQYRALVKDAVKPKGFAMIATFAKTGPEKCSGLAITQYSEEELFNQFTPEFKLIEALSYTHTTPFNTEQDFTFCLMQRV